MFMAQAAQGSACSRPNSKRRPSATHMQKLSRHTPTAHSARGPCRKTQNANPDAVCHSSSARSLLQSAAQTLTARPIAECTNMPMTRGRAKGRSLAHCSSLASFKRPGIHPRSSARGTLQLEAGEGVGWEELDDEERRGRSSTLNALQATMPSTVLQRR
jgi:hypothetical protein